MLRIHLLGQLQVTFDENPLKFAARPKTLPLWAYLLIHTGQSIPRETLAFTLWPDESEKTARVNLRRHIYDLQQALPEIEPPWLLVDARSLGWNPESPYWLDTQTFEGYSQHDESLADAVALYGGDLLTSVYEDWLYYERERLRDLYLSSLSRLVTLNAGRGSIPTAIHYAQQLLRAAPFREDAVRQLMTLLYTASNRAGALAEYDQFARLLDEELGVEPMPETTALHAQIVRNDRPSAPPQPPEPEAETRTEGPSLWLPYVGRESEMAQLHTAWSRAARGYGKIIMLGGEAGIGKTRMVSELAAQVEGQGGRVLIGSTAFSEPVAYQAIVEALYPALPLLDIARPLLSALSSLIPQLRTHHPDLPPPARLEATRERERLFEALAASLESLARGRPVLLILEDMHWASAISTDLLDYLARHIIGQPILIVITYREEEAVRAHPLRQLRRQLQKDNLLTHISLNRLPLGAIEALLEQVAQSADGLSSLLYQESEGNPLFMGELLRDWLEAGRLQPFVGDGATGQRWQVVEIASEDTESAQKAVPGGVHTVIHGRLARLSEGTRQLTEILSVVGMAFDLELVREISGWDEEAVLEGLHELLDRHLIREAYGQSRFDYTFTHHFIQTTVYDGLDATSRRRRHRRTAEVMEDLYSAQRYELAGMLAQHFDRGGRPEAAAAYYLAAAQRALEVYADQDAQSAIDRALALTDDARLRFDLVALYETIMQRRLNYDAQREMLEHMRTLAESLGDEEAICENLRRWIAYYNTLSNREQEARLLETLKTHAEASGSPRWGAEAALTEANYIMHTGNYDDALILGERARAGFEAIGDSDGVLRSHGLLMELTVHRGSFDQVAEQISILRSLVQAQNSTAVTIRYLQYSIVSSFQAQQFGICQSFSQQLRELATDVGDRRGEIHAHFYLAMIGARMFDVMAAREHYAITERLIATYGTPTHMVAYLINSAILDMMLGQIDTARAKYLRAYDMARRLNDLRGQALCANNLSGCYQMELKHAEGKAAAEDALDIAHRMGSGHLEAMALANIGVCERDLGELESGIAHMEQGVAMRRVQEEQTVSLIEEMRDLAYGYLLNRQTAQATALVDEYLTLQAQYDYHLTRAEYNLLTAAKVYRVVGDHERSKTLLAQAYATLQDRLSQLPAPDLKASYVAKFYCTEIVNAYERDHWILPVA